MKDSLIACAVVIGYLGIYLAAGFAAVGACSWVWTAVFG